MKAIVYRNYGSPDVLKLEEVQKPTRKDNEVLIKVHAASVNYIDWQILKGESFGTCRSWQGSACYRQTLPVK